MNFKDRMMTGAALTVLAIAPAVTAHAQAAGANQIGEVVVTATHTGATNIQKTPIVVDVVSGSDLKKDDIENPHDLASVVPSLVFTTTAINAQVYIRGVGGYQGGEQDVSFYTDGVYLSRLSTIQSTNFNDLDRIEVLEGPQGTLFGRNSTGGAINFISKAPSDTFGFQNTLNVGNYALIDEAARVTGPIADNMQASLSFSHAQHDGYIHNVYPGVGDPDAENRSGLPRPSCAGSRPPTSPTPCGPTISTLMKLWATNDTLLVDRNVFKGTGCTAGCWQPFPLVRNQLSYHGQPTSASLKAGPPRSCKNEIAYGVSDEFNWKINDNLSLKSLQRPSHRHLQSIRTSSGGLSTAAIRWVAVRGIPAQPGIQPYQPLRPAVGRGRALLFRRTVKQIGFVPTLAPQSAEHQSHQGSAHLAVDAAADDVQGCVLPGNLPDHPHPWAWKWACATPRNTRPSIRSTYT